MVLTKTCRQQIDHHAVSDSELAEEHFLKVELTWDGLIRQLDRMQAAGTRGRRVESD